MEGIFLCRDFLPKSRLLILALQLFTLSYLVSIIKEKNVHRPEKRISLPYLLPAACNGFFLPKLDGFYLHTSKDKNLHSEMSFFR